MVHTFFSHWRYFQSFIVSVLALAILLCCGSVNLINPPCNSTQTLNFPQPTATSYQLTLLLTLMYYHIVTSYFLSVSCLAYTNNSDGNFNSIPRSLFVLRIDGILHFACKNCWKAQVFSFFLSLLSLFFHSVPERMLIGVSGSVREVQLFYFMFLFVEVGFFWSLCGVLKQIVSYLNMKCICNVKVDKMKWIIGRIDMVGRSAKNILS